MGMKDCGVCGRVYEVVWTSVPMRDRDIEHCACGAVLFEYNAAAIPERREISGPTKAARPIQDS